MQMHEGKEAPASAQQGQAPSAIPVPFPGGLPAQIIVDDNASSDGPAGEGDVAAVALTYESPALGAMNFRIGMDGSRVVCEVRVAAGAPLDIATAAAESLRSALAEKTERAASVTVAPRVGSFNVSA
jgi:hypothetical protein